MTSYKLEHDCEGDQLGKEMKHKRAFNRDTPCLYACHGLCSQEEPQRFPQEHCLWILDERLNRVRDAVMSNVPSAAGDAVRLVRQTNDSKHQHHVQDVGKAYGQSSEDGRRLDVAVAVNQVRDARAEHGKH